MSGGDARTARPGPAGKLALIKHPPSDGAHRLAWWLCGEVDLAEAIAQVARDADTNAAMIERWLSGAVEPAEFERARIAVATGGRVLPGDWLRGGPLGWFDRPPVRDVPPRRAAAA